jgi:hypothetical protein
MRIEVQSAHTSTADTADATAYDTADVQVQQRNQEVRTRGGAIQKPRHLQHIL